MTDILPRPQNLDRSQLDMWVDESIWGHRLYDEQTPWLCLLEMLCILQSEASRGRAFVEDTPNSLQYKTSPRLYLRNILFNNPHIEAIAEMDSLDDEGRWQKWMEAISSNTGGIDSPDFSYLKSRFVFFKDFTEIVKFLQSSAIEGDSNKRWSSKFVFPYGSACLYEDLRVKDTNYTNDRRFFARSGELLYLIICRSNRGSEILSQLEKIGVINCNHLDNPGSKWNQIVLALQPPQEQTRESGSPPYLPYLQLPEYTELADDLLAILSCNLPDYDALPHIVTILGLHLVIYFLARAKSTLGEDGKPCFVLEIIAPKKTSVRDLAADEYQKNNHLSQRAIEHYIRSIVDTSVWQTCLNSSTAIEDAIDILKQRFAWSATAEELGGERHPEDLLDRLQEQAVGRHKQHLAKFHGSWTREIGLSSSRSSRRTRYAPTDALLKTLVLSSVPHRMEYQEFLATLHRKYGFIIGDLQAGELINSGNVDRGDFVANATRLERRLASIGLLKRLSDACAYVQNPFFLEVK
jgi:hypothetical protein